MSAPCAFCAELTARKCPVHARGRDRCPRCRTELLADGWCPECEKDRELEKPK